MISCPDITFFKQYFALTCFLFIALNVWDGLCIAEGSFGGLPLTAGGFLKHSLHLAHLTIPCSRPGPYSILSNAFLSESVSVLVTQVTAESDVGMPLTVARIRSCSEVSDVLSSSQAFWFQGQSCRSPLTSKMTPLSTPQINGRKKIK